MQKKYSDETLMKQLSQGNKKAAGILYDRYYQRVFGYCVKMTRNKEISRDLTQNVFMRVIRYGKSWTDDKTFRFWLFRIARNIVNDHYRETKIFFSAEDEIAINHIDHEESSKEMETKESHDILMEAMGQLPPAYREVIELSRFQGFSYKEIAQTTLSTESAVRVKAFRAVKKLKEIYTSIIIE